MSIGTLEKETAPTTGASPAVQHALSNGAVPPLQSGDHLSKAEFERRYAAHSEIKKAELIEGVVYVASPVCVRGHGVPHSQIITWLGVYQASTPGINMTDNSTFRLDLENEPQPDVAVWLEEGGAAIDADDYLAGAPELLVEVAGSSASIDLNEKLRAYRRNGVQKYLVLLTHEQEVRWYAFREGETYLLEPDADGVLHSQVLPGLALAPALFWQGNLASVLEVLQQAMATPAHADFVKRMRG